MKDFLALAQDLARETRVVIGILDDPLFAGREVPQDLGSQNFIDTWGARSDVRIVRLDSESIRSYSVLFKGKLDILVYPYGEFYPMDAPPFYTSQTINAFLKRGGAVLTTGGVPFGMPTNTDNPVAINGGDPLSRIDLDPNRYEKWVAPLGVKYYLHPFTPTVTHVDTRYLHSLPETLEVAGCPLGIVINNSNHEPEPKPPHGNVFPERYPARQVMPLLWGSDKYGQTLAVNALLVQDFQNGSRRIHFAHEASPHPLSPSAPHFAKLMEDLLTLLTNRVMAVDVEANYACFRQGEAVEIRGELCSFEQNACDVEAVFEIYDEQQLVASHDEPVSIQPGARVAVNWTWVPGRFGSDLYRLVLVLRRGGEIISSTENGFVVWNDDVIRQGPQIIVQDEYLHIKTGANDTAFVTGTNYYESTRGEIMWYRPQVLRIARDLQEMSTAGVNYIRPHYHHLKWFRDYLMFQHGHLFDYYTPLESVSEPFPDEHGWRIMDMFIYLCQKFGIVYGGDLFTLVPEEMGDPRGWFPLREGIYAAEKRAVQKEFFRRINERYKDVPGISWDLWNEPVVPLDALRDWTSSMRQVIEEASIHRLITVGGGVGADLGSLVDYICPHMRVLRIREHVNQSGRPMMMQEVHNDHPEDLASERHQAEDLRDGFLAAVQNGMCGFAPWSWCRQQRLWQDVYQHHHTFPIEKWDDRLGTHVHDDGTVKPAGQVFTDLGVLLRSIPFERFDPETGRIQTSCGEVKVSLAQTLQRGYSLYHIAENRCFAGMAQTNVTWNGQSYLSGPQGSYLYVLSADGEDLLTSKRIYLKTELPGTVLLPRRSAVQSLELVIISAQEHLTIDTLDYKMDDHTLEIAIAPTQQAYWVLVEWA